MASTIDCTYKEHRSNPHLQLPDEENCRQCDQPQAKYQVEEEKPSTSFDFERMASVLTAQAALKCHHAALRDLLNQAVVDRSAALQALNASIASATILDSFAGDIQALVPPSSRPSNRSAQKAEQVFAIPELLEQVLLYLPPKELLDAMEVNRAFHNTIQGSAKLQEILCLRPTKGHTFYSHFSDDDESDTRSNSFCRSIDVGANSIYLSDHNPTRRIFSECNEDAQFSETVHAEFTCEIPKLGSRVRSMLVCQPPLTEITVMFNWRNCQGEFVYREEEMTFKTDSK